MWEVIHGDPFRLLLIRKQIFLASRHDGCSRKLFNGTGKIGASVFSTDAEQSGQASFSSSFAWVSFERKENVLESSYLSFGRQIGRVICKFTLPKINLIIEGSCPDAPPAIIGACQSVIASSDDLRKMQESHVLARHFRNGKTNKFQLVAFRNHRLLTFVSS